MGLIINAGLTVTLAFAKIQSLDGYSPNGEPDAVVPLVRFGGRGRLHPCLYPYPKTTITDVPELRPYLHPSLMHGLEPRNGVPRSRCRSVEPKGVGEGAR